MESSAESDDEILHPYDPEAPLVSASSYYYPFNSVSNNSINVAIHEDNFERFVQLLNEGKDLNLADSRGFTALHVAAYCQDLKVLDVLLQQPLIRKDVRSHRGETPLLISFLSLFNSAEDALIIKLIESGCDVTIPNLENVTPLSLAVRRRSVTVARLLIQKGADIDAKDFDGYTPLHNAVTASCYEAVCMLLYYNASVNEVSSNTKVTPFMLALNMRNDQIAEVLFDYVTDFNAVDHQGSSTLFLALSSGSSLTRNILLHCDINNVEDNYLCLKEAMMWKDPSMFKYLFSKINHVELARKSRVLRDLMYSCEFNTADFLECLYLILGSKHAWLFVEKCRTIIPLVSKFYSERISQEDRVKSLYLLFASGLSICYYDFWYIYKYFGFDKELETVFIAQPIIRTDSICTGMLDYAENYANLAFNIFNNYCGKVDEMQVWGLIKSNFQILIDYLRYFTIDYYCKQNYFKLQQPSERFDGITKKLNERDVASLKELCRNEIRNVITIKTQARDNMYRLYEAIKTLPVPKVIQDILHLKQPLYR